ncbi:DUF86 domain-containing protein [Rufibacter glacialis]|uniref:DUF86 domain-containing protein n=1 Tax=Rufibacter glacialis TaxID=1259555 RepID=A0A5M8QPB6_9BACT|nr:DUF86 domain-containing protein [Rufibacter glacialis]KAA6437138.1 DUF86 domain-containing protein [Rufibacter glacialis]GGK61818.1 DUF86 domain-containing protein [Rufibacter glacialis]
MRNKQGDVQRLQHIADAISDIEAFTKGVTFDSFSSNRMMVLACVKCFEIIGEAAGHLSEETKAEYTSIDWRNVKAFRNLMVHEYFKVSDRLVWQIIESNLPDLKRVVAKAIAALNTNLD